MKAVKRIALSLVLVLAVFLFGHFVLPFIYVDSGEWERNVSDALTKETMVFAFVFGYLMLLFIDRQQARFDAIAAQQNINGGKI